MLLIGYPMHCHSSPQTGSGAGYNSGYSVPNTAYQLLLGACRLGCEPLVNIILALPLMAAITSDELQKACEIAQNCGHTNLYEVLQQMVIMAGIPQAQMISRDPTGSGNEEKKGHVEEYYTAMNKLSNGGITPEGACLSCSIKGEKYEDNLASLCAGKIIFINNCIFRCLKKLNCYQAKNESFILNSESLAIIYSNAPLSITCSGLPYILASVCDGVRAMVIV